MDLAKLTDFCHTGKIEVCDSMMLKYVSKREHHSYQGMVVRTQQTASDNNVNAKALIKPGEQARHATSFAFQKQTRDGLSNQKKQEEIIPVLVRSSITSDQSCDQENAVPLQPYVQLPRNVASKQAPTKTEATQQHHSRFDR